MTEAHLAIWIQSVATVATVIVAVLAWRTSRNALAAATAAKTEERERSMKTERSEFAALLYDLIDKVLSSAWNDMSWQSLLTPLEGPAAEVSSRDAPAILSWLRGSVAVAINAKTSTNDPSARLRKAYVDRVADWVASGKFDHSAFDPKPI